MPAAHRARVTVAVLGDLGRSPRMLYHARALGDSECAVDLVGYCEHALPPAVGAHGAVRVHALRTVAPAAVGVPRPLFVLHAAGRVLRQSWELLWTLLVRVPRPDVILLQSPPAIPTLVIALAVARARGARLVVDWHNFGWAVLALRLGRDHVLVRLARRYERAAGRRADAHLCVSQAMARELARGWGVHGAAVLPDRPAEAFAPTPLAERHALFRRLAPALAVDPAPSAGGADADTALLTRRIGDGRHALRPDRPALVVSPTSWTADEDFGLLVDALARLEATIRAYLSGAEGREFPRLLVVVTGDGPLRARYEAEIGALGLTRILVRTLWLAADDYPRFLGSADLGLCLHRSASGVDLPMKVADMLGAGLPVCALDYGPCLGEQLREGDNARLFTTGAELAAQLFGLFRGFPADTAELDRLAAAVRGACGTRWQEAWRAAAAPILVA